MKLGIGDKVSFLNEKGEGIVTKIIDKTMVGVTIEEGFELPFAVSELILIESAKKEIPTPPADVEIKIDPVKFFQQKSQGSIKRSKPHARKNEALKMEIDLHIEELLDDFKGMSNAEIIQVQLSHFRRALDKSITGHFQRLIVIHGVGNGRLKHEVCKILEEENLKFYDASYAKYGFGATEIVIG